MEHEQDLGDRYLSYGSLVVSWYCHWYDPSADEDCGCEWEWKTPMRVEIRLFPEAELTS